jgi:hypothetical protein
VKKLFFIITLSFLFCGSLSAQNEAQDIRFDQDSVATAAKPRTIDPLAPSKAAFYSAIVPGLGQVYNKSYWKVPLVYGGMALSLYYYSWNNREYHRYRDAYKDKLAGRDVTGELANLDNDRLIRGQRFHQKNRDLSMLITVGIYLLNIVDANVDAHLTQFNVDENLTLRPQLQQNSIDYKHNLGLSLTYQF